MQYTLIPGNICFKVSHRFIPEIYGIEFKSVRVFASTFYSSLQNNLLYFYIFFCFNLNYKRATMRFYFI